MNKSEANVNSSEALARSDASQLLKLMSVGETTSGALRTEDLPAMLRHQLLAPLEFGPRKVPASLIEARKRSVKSSPRAEGSARTFKDLLDDPQPPLELLKMAKDYFKDRAGGSDERQPEQAVAYLMYQLAITLARVRLENPITRLADSDLLKGAQWVLAQEWVEEKTRTFFAEASRRLA